MPPEVVKNDEVELLQIICSRKLFMESFHLMEDNEIDFLVTFDKGGNSMGKLKVIKTRDLFIVEAHIPFEVSHEMMCEEDYNFPED